MSNVATLPQKQSFSLTPQTLDEAMQFAGMMSKSNIVPKDYQGNPRQRLGGGAVGHGTGPAAPPGDAEHRRYHQRPLDLGRRDARHRARPGLLESIKEDISETGAVCTLKRRGEDAVSREFTVEDAKRAGLLGKQGPWQQHPKRMMQMRARAFALRDVFPDVLRGVNIAEEARDMPVERTWARPRSSNPPRRRPARPNPCATRSPRSVARPARK